MSDMERSLSILKNLRDMGIEIAIDDFGTGYSSLGHLRRFPIHTVKIDRSFITDLPRNRDSLAITEAIVAMAHKLNLKVVVEGVETDEQRVLLCDQGCDAMQGYLFSPPVHARQWPSLWSRHADDGSATPAASV